MARKNTKCTYHKNRAMGGDTYALRREVMGVVYQAKKLLGGAMQRVEIRITDCQRPEVLGSARMGDCVVWIPAKTLKQSKLVLRHVVLHELLHALFAVPHAADCSLMAPVLGKTTKAQQDRAFLKHAKAA